MTSVRVPPVKSSQASQTERKQPPSRVVTPMGIIPWINIFFSFFIIIPVVRGWK